MTPQKRPTVALDPALLKAARRGLKALEWCLDCLQDGDYEYIRGEVELLEKAIGKAKRKEKG